MRARPIETTGRARRRKGARRLPGWLRRLADPAGRWFAREWGPVGRALAAWPVVALILLAVPALVAAYQVPRPLALGAADRAAARYLGDFFPVEYADGIPFRWTDDEVRLVVPAVAGDRAWDLVLRVGSQRPPGIASPTLDVYADERLIGRVETVPEFRDYRFRIARPTLAPENLTIRLATTPFDPPGAADDRRLGLALNGATLLPTADRWPPALPPPGHALLVLALVALIAGMLGWLGVPTPAMAGALAAAIGGIALGQVWRPDYTAAFLRPLLVAALVLAAALVALRPVVRRLFAAGGVALSPRDERVLLGIVAGGAALHLAGIVFPTFRPHDLGFHANRVSDILEGRFLLTSVVSEWGFRRTPYGPALYVLAAPIAALVRDPTWPLRYLVPVLDATSAALVCYLLRRCRAAEPAPLLAAAFTVLVPASAQLLWWGFFSNLLGQWGTLVVLMLVVGHWAELPRRPVFVALVLALALTLLSHPGTFILTVALLPPLGLALAFALPEGRRSLIALGAALALSLAVVYLLYYRFFTGMFVEQAWAMFSGVAPALPDNADVSRGWEWPYIALRLFAFPFLLYVVCAVVVGVGLARARAALGWMILAILATATLFGAVHVVAGVWVRYFVFVGPALASAAGVAVAWLLRRGALGRVLAGAALLYCGGAALVFWFAITFGGNRSPYP